MMTKDEAKKLVALKLAKMRAVRAKVNAIVIRHKAAGLKSGAKK